MGNLGMENKSVNGVRWHASLTWHKGQKSKLNNPPKIQGEISYSDVPTSGTLGSWNYLTPQGLICTDFILQI